MYGCSLYPKFSPSPKKHTHTHAKLRAAKHSRTSTSPEWFLGGKEYSLRFLPALNELIDRIPLATKTPKFHDIGISKKKQEGKVLKRVSSTT